jgi:hypothetical protein
MPYLKRRVRTWSAWLMSDAPTAEVDLDSLRRYGELGPASVSSLSESTLIGVFAAVPF